MCDWLVVDIGGLMYGTRAYPEKRRSVGQGNTELSWLRGLRRMAWWQWLDCWGCWQYRICLVVSIIAGMLYMTPLREQGEVMWCGEVLSSWWCARPLPLSLSPPALLCGELSATPQHHITSPLLTERCHIQFQWVFMVGKNNLHHQHHLCSGSSTQSMHPHLTFLLFSPILFYYCYACLVTPLTQVAVFTSPLSCVLRLLPFLATWPQIH